MKSLQQYIQEKHVIKKRNNLFDYKYFTETKEELIDIVLKRIKKEGKEVDLNDIDTSNITDMSYLFSVLDFNGDISKWDVSNVTNMSNMFYRCESFNQDISNWDVSKVISMWGMFCGCKDFNQDISSWDVSKVKDMRYMFDYCPIEEKYKPKFK